MSVTAKSVAPQRDQSPSNMTASYWLEAMNEIGVDYLFCNMGTDHAPIIEAMAQWRHEGRKYPKVILCPHENTAVHMAIGYYLTTGKPQLTMHHVNVGTANALNGLLNAARGQVPRPLMLTTSPASFMWISIGAAPETCT